VFTFPWHDAPEAFKKALSELPRPRFSPPN
jgi:hypothetical protein